MQNDYRYGDVVSWKFTCGVWAGFFCGAALTNAAWIVWYKIAPHVHIHLWWR